MNIYLVGGAVRDTLLGIEVLEQDWVVVGGTENDLKRNGYKKIGKDFPVFLHPDSKEEYALARKERKSGLGHKAFEFEFDSSVTLEEDLLRRDLTINAIAQDEEGKLIDPYNGIKDIENKVIRKVSSSFKEDPLRVLRVARFASKLNFLQFTIERDTLESMKEISLSGEIKTLSKERIWMETHKALITKNPEIYFLTLQQVGALDEVCPLEVMNIEELNNSSEETEDIAIRWAVLVSGNQNMQEINTSFNLPKEFIEISGICDLLIKFRATPFSAHSILEIIHQSDLIRKPERFFRAEKASSFFKSSNQQIAINWEKLYDLVSNVEAEIALKNGKLIAKKLQEDRLQVLENYLSKI